MPPGSSALPGVIAYALFVIVGVLLHAVLAAALLFIAYSAILVLVVGGAGRPRSARA